MLRIPAALLLGLPYFDLEYHSGRLLVRSRTGADAFLCGPGFFPPDSLTGQFLMEVTGPPRFQGDPNACMPRSPTPARSGRDAVPRPDVAFRLPNSVGPHEGKLSRLNHAAYRLPVYASQCRLPQHHARLGSGRQHTYRVGLATHWVPLKGFSDDFYINQIPLSLAFLAHWANLLSRAAGARPIAADISHPC